jgi:hypothetical protein
MSTKAVTQPRLHAFVTYCARLSNWFYAACSYAFQSGPRALFDQLLMNVFRHRRCLRSLNTGCFIVLKSGL